MPILIGLAKVLVAWTVGLLVVVMIESLHPIIQKAWRKFGTMFPINKLKLVK